MSRPRQSIKKSLQKHLPQNSALLIAVSGGKDSVCLLHSCVEIAPKLHLALEVAHLDHGLRPASAKDAEFVEELAKKYRLPFHLQRASAPPAGQNIEEWGRERRYAFFKELCKKRSLSYTLTAHTANDVAETLLMRLVANKELRTIARTDERRMVLRPFLDLSRDVIDAYAAAHGLSFVEDETNRDLSFLRNKVRHVLLPILEKDFDPRIVEVLAAAALRVEEDNADMQLLAGKELEGLKEEDIHSPVWLRNFKKKCVGLSPALQWRVMEELLLPFIGYKLGREAAKSAFDVLMGRRLGIEFEGGKSLRREEGRLIFGPTFHFKE